MVFNLFCKGSQMKTKINVDTIGMTVDESKIGNTISRIKTRDRDEVLQRLILRLLLGIFYFTTFEPLWGKYG